MALFLPHKVIATLPATLEPNAVYAVRVGAGFDLYIVDSTGTYAHKVNDNGVTAGVSTVIESVAGAAPSATGISVSSTDPPSVTAITLGVDMAIQVIAGITSRSLIRLKMGNGPEVVIYEYTGITYVGANYIIGVSFVGATHGFAYAASDPVSIEVTLMGASGAGTPVGMLGYWPATTPPADWLVCDGSSMTIASYPALADLLYCGSGNNALASWGYKSTTAISPSTHRSTSGTYLVLPDHRDRYVRGFKSGGSFGMWTYYDDTLKSHSHTYQRAHGGAPYTGGSGGAGWFWTQTLDNSGASGDAETRPKTAMALPIIYAGP